MSSAKPSDVSESRVYHFPDRSMRRLLQAPDYVRYLVEILMPELVEFLDFDSGVQQNRSFLSAALQERESDVVLRVPFRESIDREALHICILIEHQSRSERLMRLRLLIYIARIWESEYQQLESRGEGQQQWSPILPIVFYTGSDRWKAPMPLTEALNIPQFMEAFVPAFKVLFLDVKRTERETLTKSGHPFGWLLRVLQEEDADKTEFHEVLATSVSEISRSGETQDSQLWEALNYLILLIYHRRSEGERDAFVDLIKAQSPDEKEIEIMAQTAAEALIEQGKAEGILEGIEQGREEGMEQGIEQGARQMSIESTLRILTRRFPDADVNSLKPTLEAIEDLDRLVVLNTEAFFAESFHTFQEDLDA